MQSMQFLPNHEYEGFWDTLFFFCSFNILSSQMWTSIFWLLLNLRSIPFTSKQPSVIKTKQSSSLVQVRNWLVGCSSRCQTGCHCLIIAVRNESKRDAVKADIVKSTPPSKTQVVVWNPDQESMNTMTAFEDVCPRAVVSCHGHTECCSLQIRFVDISRNGHGVITGF